MKINKKLLLITSLVCLLPIIAGLLVYDRLPAEIAIHWGVHGEANGWAPKGVAIFLLPGIMVLVNLILHFGLETDPKKGNMSPALKKVVIWIIPVLSFICSFMTLGIALNYPLRVEVVIPVFVGIILILIGNYLPKTKQSYSMGIKLPWTLNSEENWNRTHRMAGFLWVAAGIAFVVLSLLQCWTTWLIVAILVVIALAPMIYSYCLYKKGI